MGIGKQTAHPDLEAFNPACQHICHPGAEGRLGNIEDQEHHQRKNRQTCHRAGDNRIDFVLVIVVFGKDFPGFHLGNNLIDKGKPLPVCNGHRLFAGQIHISLMIGRFLFHSGTCHCCLHHFFQITAVGIGGNGLKHRAAQLPGQQLHINDCVLLFVDIGLIQSHHHRNPQFHQLGGEEQAAA